jgi:hypothetical protein
LFGIRLEASGFPRLLVSMSPRLTKDDQGVIKDIHSDEMVVFDSHHLLKGERLRDNHHQHDV